MASPPPSDSTTLALGHAPARARNPSARARRLQPAGALGKGLLGIYLTALVLLALYGKGSPVGIDVAFTRISVALALLFVTLPFVVRSVQPVLGELDLSMEEAAASLGARPPMILRRIVLPGLMPAIISGVALSFARAVGEFGSLVLITGNLPFKTEVGSVYVFGQIENENLPAAAAVSVVLLLAAVAVLGALTLLSRWSSRHVR